MNNCDQNFGDEVQAGLIRRISRHLLPNPPSKLGVAVSGGGDSIALLHLLAIFCARHNISLAAVTVDHGLRAEAAREAQEVARIAETLAVPHTVQRWSDWDGSGNLQDRARRARYALMTGWAKENNITSLALGHTADDQAETVLMRLSRSSGVDGLAAMQPRRTQNGVTLVRPMLDIARSELREYLLRNELRWAEDPSNNDTRFERIKIRQALEILAPLGITAPVLAQVAEQMGRAREALDWYCFLAARDCSRVDGGDIVIDLKKFRILPHETARRLLLRAVMWVGGAEYPPRRRAVSDLVDAVRAGRSFTLDGCIVACHKGSMWVCREYNAVRLLTGRAHEAWDNRWQLSGPFRTSVEEPENEGLVVRALGHRGLAMCPDWRETGRPRAGLLASPSVWCGENLVSAPQAGRAAGWHIGLTRSPEEFFSALLSH